VKFTKSTVYVVKMTELIKIKVCAVYLRLSLHVFIYIVSGLSPKSGLSLGSWRTTV